MFGGTVLTFPHGRSRSRSREFRFRFTYGWTLASGIISPLTLPVPLYTIICIWMFWRCNFTVLRLSLGFEFQYSCMEVGTGGSGEPEE